MTAALRRYTAWHLVRGQDNDSAEIWASDHDDAVRRAIMQGYGRPRCRPNDWDRVQMADGRKFSRADYERMEAA